MFRLIALKGTDGQGISCYWFMIVPYRKFLLWIGNNILSPVEFPQKHRKHHLASLIQHWGELGLLENVSHEKFLAQKNNISLVVEFDYTQEPNFVPYWLGLGFEDCCAEDKLWQNAVSVHIKILKEIVWKEYADSIEVMIDTLIQQPKYTQFIIDYPLINKTNKCIGFMVFPGVAKPNN